MKEFNIDKKGYCIKEVDEYLISSQIEQDRLISEKQARINELRAENITLTKKLNEYKQKEAFIASALTNATQKASEIEENAKKLYNLEIQNVKALYEKWNNFLNELINRYPKMKDFDTNEVLNSMNNEINKTLSKDFNIEPSHEKETAIQKNSFKSLLSRLHAYSNSNKDNKQIKRKEISRQQKIETENELEYLSEQNRVNNIKPITNLKLENDEVEEFENLVDKFLNTQNVHPAKGYEKSILNSKKQKSNYYPAPNDSGFDFEEALNPTEDLLSIMKGFNLDD